MVPDQVGQGWLRPGALPISGSPLAFLVDTQSVRQTSRSGDSAPRIRGLGLTHHLFPEEHHISVLPGGVLRGQIQAILVLALR